MTISLPQRTAVRPAPIRSLQSLPGQLRLFADDVVDTQPGEQAWMRHEREVDLKSSSKKAKERRMECVWTNY